MVSLSDSIARIHTPSDSKICTEVLQCLVDRMHQFETTSRSTSAYTRWSIGERERFEEGIERRKKNQVGLQHFYE